jgi:hypothetical protein
MLAHWCALDVAEAMTMRRILLVITLALVPYVGGAALPLWLVQPSISSVSSVNFAAGLAAGVAEVTASTLLGSDTLIVSSHTSPPTSASQAVAVAAAPGVNASVDTPVPVFAATGESTLAVNTMFARVRPTAAVEAAAMAQLVTAQLFAKRVVCVSDGTAIELFAAVLQHFGSTCTPVVLSGAVPAGVATRVLHPQAIVVAATNATWIAEFAATLAPIAAPLIVSQSAGFDELMSAFSGSSHSVYSISALGTSKDTTFANDFIAAVPTALHESLAALEGYMTARLIAAVVAQVPTAQRSSAAVAEALQQSAFVHVADLMFGPISSVCTTGACSCNPGPQLLHAVKFNGANWTSGGVPSLNFGSVPCEFGQRTLDDQVVFAHIAVYDAAGVYGNTSESVRRGIRSVFDANPAVHLVEASVDSTRQLMRSITTLHDTYNLAGLLAPIAPGATTSASPIVGAIQSDAGWPSYATGAYDIKAPMDFELRALVELVGSGGTVHVFHSNDAPSLLLVSLWQQLAGNLVVTELHQVSTTGAVQVPTSGWLLPLFGNRTELTSHVVLSAASAMPNTELRLMMLEVECHWARIALQSSPSILARTHCSEFGSAVPGLARTFDPMFDYGVAVGRSATAMVSQIASRGNVAYWTPIARIAVGDIAVVGPYTNGSCTDAACVAPRCNKGVRRVSVVEASTGAIVSTSSFDSCIIPASDAETIDEVPVVLLATVIAVLAVLVGAGAVALCLFLRHRSSVEALSEDQPDPDRPYDVDDEASDDLQTDLAHALLQPVAVEIPNLCGVPFQVLVGLVVLVPILCLCSFSVEPLLRLTSARNEQSARAMSISLASETLRCIDFISVEVMDLTARRVGTSDALYESYVSRRGGQTSVTDTKCVQLLRTLNTHTSQTVRDSLPSAVAAVSSFHQLRANLSHGSVANVTLHAAEVLDGVVAALVGGIFTATSRDATAPWTESLQQLAATQLLAVSLRMLWTAANTGAASTFQVAFAGVAENRGRLTAVVSLPDSVFASIGVMDTHTATYTVALTQGNASAAVAQCNAGFCDDDMAQVDAVFAVLAESVTRLSEPSQLEQAIWVVVVGCISSIIIAVVVVVLQSKTQTYLDQQIDTTTLSRTTASTFVPVHDLSLIGCRSIIDVAPNTAASFHGTVLLYDFALNAATQFHQTVRQEFEFFQQQVDVLGTLLEEEKASLGKLVCGDELIICFSDCEAALRIAVSLHVKLDQANVKCNTNSRNASEDTNVRAATALHTGEICLGLVDVAKRLTSVALSPHINFARRLMKHAHTISCRLMMSETSRSECDSASIEHRAVGYLGTNDCGFSTDDPFATAPTAVVYDVFQTERLVVKRAKRESRRYVERAVKLLRHNKIETTTKQHIAEAEKVMAAAHVTDPALSWLLERFQELNAKHGRAHDIKVHE